MEETGKTKMLRHKDPPVYTNKSTYDTCKNMLKHINYYRHILKIRYDGHTESF